MKGSLYNEENLVRAAFEKAVGNVPNRMPSLDEIRATVKKMPVACAVQNKKPRRHSAMPLAAAMALCLIFPALFADRSESLAVLVAKAARNGSLQRCGETIVLALTEGGRNFGFKP